MIYLIALGASVSGGWAVFIAAAELLAGVSAAMRGLRLQGRLAQPGRGRLFATAVQVVLRRVMKVRVAAGLARKAGDAGLGRPEETAFLIIAGVAGLGGVITAVLGPTLPAAAALAVLILAVSAWLKRRAGERLERFSEQLPSILKSVASALQASASVPQALAHAADQAGQPAKDELDRVNENIALGLPVDAALSGLYERLPAAELKYVLIGLAIQRRVGGNLVKLLAETTRALEERRRLQRHLAIETAQARLSARVIGFLPIVVTALIAVLDPSFMAPMFTTSVGLAMVLLAAAAEAVGFLLLNQILEVSI